MTKEIEEKIDQAFTEMVQVYSYDDFKKFEERTFGKQSVGELSKSTEETKLADLVEKIKTKTKEKIQKRQESLREYGVEVGISVAFDGRGKLDKKKKDDLEKLVKENPEYFGKLLSGEKKLHLRGQSIIYRFMDKIGLSHTQKNILAEITIIKDNLDNLRPEISPRIPAAPRQPSREGQTLTQEDPPILSTTTNGLTLSEPKPEIIPTKEEIIPTKEEITKAAPSESVVARSISVKERAKQFEKAKDNKPVSEEKQKIETGVKVSQLRAAFEQRQTYTTTAHTKKSTSTGPTR